MCAFLLFTSFFASSQSCSERKNISFQPSFLSAAFRVYGPCGLLFSHLQVLSNLAPPKFPKDWELPLQSTLNVFLFGLGDVEWLLSFP